MTSQIAIFNPLGVAVASDTVTTLVSESSTKTTNNAEKIWPLVGGHLVVVAMSGSVNSNGIHSRLLISEWNKTLSEPLATLKDYAESFTEWFSGEENLIPRDTEVAEMNFYLNDHFYEIRRRVLGEVRDNEIEDEDEVTKLFFKVAQQGLDHLSSLPLFDLVSDSSDQEFIDSSQIKLDEKIDYIFNGFPGLDVMRPLLKESAPLVLSRAQTMPSDTTLAFIGYGAQEHFAHCVELRCRGRYGARARVFIEDVFPASSNYNGGQIQAFAQSDAIFGFLRGSQDSVLNHVYEQMWDYIVEKGDESEESIKEAETVLSKIQGQTQKFMFDSFSSPLLGTIESLNLKDVAELAEALVGIQAMRATASPEPAGVGGFIESLVIDKFEGIRWIKRLPR